MASRRKGLLLPILCALYVSSVLVALFLLKRYADSWWPATLLAFGPRWPLLMPAVVLLPLAAWRRRKRWVIATAVAGALVLGPYMDLCVPFPRSQPAAVEGARELNLASYNVQERRITDIWVQRVVKEIDADILVLEECRSETYGKSEMYGYQVATVYGLCMFSRFPITAVHSRDPKDAWKKNGKAAIMRVELDVEGRLIHVMALHLATVRAGLQAMRYERLDGIPQLRSNIELRDWESLTARQWANRAGDEPLLVLGDLNLTTESDIYRSYWSHLVNAFEECGSGYGDTKHTKIYSVRIDHILMSDAFRCHSASVDDRGPSDHTPLRAVVQLLPPDSKG